MKGLQIGRIVHYVDYNYTHVAAIITQIYDKDKGLVSLTIFPGNQESDKPSAVHYVFYNEDVDSKCGCWHWPEYVE